MSDAGVLEAVQAEIVAFIRGTDEGGVVAVEEARSVRDLILSEEGRLPAIGVAYRGWDREDQRPIGTRVLPVRVRFEVAVVVRDERGQSAALETVMNRLAIVRDRLHWQKCSTDPGSRYLAAGEEIEDVEADLVAGVATYLINVRLGL